MEELVSFHYNQNTTVDAGDAHAEVTMKRLPEIHIAPPQIMR